MTYEEIKKQALDDFISIPAKASMAGIIAHQRYKKAFNEILKRKGSVSQIDIEEYFKHNKEVI